MHIANDTILVSVFDYVISGYWSAVVYSTSIIFLSKGLAAHAENGGFKKLFMKKTLKR